MHRQKLALLVIILLGGGAVLVSYASALLADPATLEAAWGGVTGQLRQVYVIFQVLAALGYFAYTYYILFRLDAREAQIANRFGFWAFTLIYVAILIPSALYLPLTFRMLEYPNTGNWLAIRVVLAIVGLASLGLIGSLLSLRPRHPVWAYWLAVAGSVAFSIQTALLDAVVWPAVFPL